MSELKNLKRYDEYFATNEAKLPKDGTILKGKKGKKEFEIGIVNASEWSQYGDKKDPDDQFEGVEKLIALHKFDDKDATEFGYAVIQNGKPEETIWF